MPKPNDRSERLAPVTETAEGVDSTETAPRRRSKVLRPPGFVVFALFVVLVLGLWYLYADTLVERSVEDVGASLVGARVDVDFADIQPTEASVRLVGLQVANPDAPMRNLLQAEEIVADLMLEPLLEKKVVVQQLTVSGVRFNTERETSGELENPDPEAGRLWREVNQWADQIQMPELRLDNLGGIVRTEAIHPDSLATVRYAREVRSRADSMRTAWRGQLEALDPRPRIDSVAAVTQRLEAFRPNPLNALQVPGLIRDGRAAIDNVTRLGDEITALRDSVQVGVASLAIGSDVVDRLRAEDLAYAWSLLDIPRLDAPSISPALFGGTALTWLKPVLYWAHTAERFLPPGLDPRNRPGPRRARAQGTTYDFREGADYPKFLLQQGDVDLLIGGSGLAAGSYTARVRGLTSAPSLLGQPMEIALGREGGVRGPAGISLNAVLDHTTETLRDSIALRMIGVELPDVDLDVFGGRLGLGVGQAGFDLQRTGEQIGARLTWRSENLEWSGAPVEAVTEAGRDALLGSAEWARNLVWRTLTGVESVELEMGLSGTMADPSVSVRSNLGEAVAASLRRELGQEIEAAEARVRTEVERQIQPVLQEARGRVEQVRSGVAAEVEARRREVEELRARLEERVGELVGGAGT